MKVLFVCTGNTCRSPMAEALLKHKMPNARVQSAGIYAGKDERAARNAMEAMKNRGIKLDHYSRPVDISLLNWADLVLAMTTGHKQLLIMQYPQFQEKYFTLKEYVSDTDKEVWDELKKRYAEYETKRAKFIQENQHHMNNHLLDQKLKEHLQDEYERIVQLEGNLTNYDISDPFGGDLATYEKTLAELETYVDKLIKIINKQ